MLLLAAATEKELEPAAARCAATPGLHCLVTGVGPMETAVVLANFFSRQPKGAIRAVVNFGVAGACPGSGLALLDICLARREVLADFGICTGTAVVPFDTFPAPQFSMDEKLTAEAASFLAANNVPFWQGTFLTVNSCSGSAERGRDLAGRYDGLCENMEGAAVARVCQEQQTPCVAIRCISNFVEDRNLANWKLAEAAEKGGRIVAALAAALCREDAP